MTGRQDENERRLHQVINDNDIDYMNIFIDDFSLHTDNNIQVVTKSNLNSDVNFSNIESTSSGELSSNSTITPKSNYYASPSFLDQSKIPDSSTVSHDNLFFSNFQSNNQELFRSSQSDGLFPNFNSLRNSGTTTPSSNVNSSAVDSTVNQLFQFARKLFQLVNSGLFGELTQLLKSNSTESCLFTWKRSIYYNEKIGPTALVDYFKAYQNTSPDAILLLRSVEHHFTSDTLIVIKCQLLELFTPVYNQYLQQFHGNDRIFYDRIDNAELMNLSNINRVSNNYSTYLSSVNSSQLQISNNVITFLSFDINTLQLLRYDEVVQLKSIKLRNM